MIDSLLKSKNPLEDFEYKPPTSHDFNVSDDDDDDDNYPYSPERHGFLKQDENVGNYQEELSRIEQGRNKRDKDDDDDDGYSNVNRSSNNASYSNNSNTSHSQYKRNRSSDDSGSGREYISMNKLSINKLRSRLRTHSIINEVVF